MAVVAILLSSAFGFLIGLAQFAFLGVPLWQAFITYVVASVSLSTFAIGWSLVLGHFSQVSANMADASPATLETWQDWQAEEEMEADRLRTDIDKEAPATRRSA